MDGLSAEDIRSLEYVAEDLSGLVFDEAILHRLGRLGLAQPSGALWVLTAKGRRTLERAQAD